jgi:hypothetical protein
VVGDWETLGDDGELELDLDYGDDDPFEEISEDWIVVAYDANSITIREEDDDEPATTLVFERL